MGWFRRAVALAKEVREELEDASSVAHLRAGTWNSGPARVVEVAPRHRLLPELLEAAPSLSGQQLRAAIDLGYLSAGVLYKPERERLFAESVTTPKAILEVTGLVAHLTTR